MTSGGRREVLAEVSRMAGGTSPVGPGALSATSPAPPGPPDMVHYGDAGGRWQGQRVTPAVTRSQAKRDGLWPGMFALMTTQDDITRSIAELSPPDVVEQELPSELACNMETPETYVQAHTGPHSDIWMEAEDIELRGLNATGTFEAAGSKHQRGTNVVSAKWVYSLKVNELGHVVRAKAGLVTRGFAQLEGIDLFETFSPCPSVASIRLLAAIACEFGWDLSPFDAEQAFVQSKLHELAFIRLPPGCGEIYGKVIKLGRSLYGLRQSSRT